MSFLPFFFQNFGATGPCTSSDQQYQVLTYSYGPAHHASVRGTDELHRTTTYQLDAVGNVHVVTTADGATWTYTYYPQRMLHTATAPYGNQTISSYDRYGRLTRVHNPDGTFRAYAYDDLAGNASAVTDENGATTRYVYDAMNRVMTAGLDRKWRAATVQRDVRPGDRVLDACCGTGDLAVAALRGGAPGGV